MIEKRKLRQLTGRKLEAYLNAAIRRDTKKLAMLIKRLRKLLGLLHD